MCAVVVVQKVLIDEFSGAIGSRAGHEDRGCVPHAGVAELRRHRRRVVEDVWPRPGSRARVERRGAGSARKRRTEHKRAPKRRDDVSPHRPGE